MTTIEQWQQADALLSAANEQVRHAGRLIAPGVGAAGEDIRQIVDDTVEKIEYVQGLIEDERAAGVAREP